MVKCPSNLGISSWFSCSQINCVRCIILQVLVIVWNVLEDGLEEQLVNLLRSYVIEEQLTKLLRICVKEKQCATSKPMREAKT